ncbi:MAG: hypothetical protein WAN65_20590, partial [Candidatus Sulfotelmatobacter sp.]
LMSAVRKAKAQGPFAWFTNPHVLYDVISGMIDKNSRPIFDPNQVVQRLFGWPIYDTTWIAQDQTLGSTATCSYILFTNPKYLMLAEPGTLEIAVNSWRRSIARWMRKFLLIDSNAEMPTRANLCVV